MGGLSEVRAAAEGRLDLANKLGKRAAGRLRQLGESSGSQLLELALTLPFLLILAIGISDMGGAYNLKHIMTNAARDAARITVSNGTEDSSCQETTPCSIEGAADAAKQYLVNAGKSAASCISPKSPTSSGTLTWTYSCPNGISLTINRKDNVTGGALGSIVVSTQVTLTYPYTWTFGGLIGLLVNGSTITLPATLTTNVVMENLV
jgi:Flp pilus assembly protein TadG